MNWNNATTASPVDLIVGRQFTERRFSQRNAVFCRVLGGKKTLFKCERGCDVR